MPELSDDMYCSQQIMVPPMFPYILRQYAKAAIRSQPTDLLRWSTAYFRCLSLNLPPPVKPRLEYPLPKDYDGVTPGWLKALLYQLANNSHVDFKVLWDRWIGACQNHLTLIKILCLGGFTDPMAIPLLRFIGLCVGFLSENLTQTMILFCEVVTEEPEGGSAMITVETFIDVYTFLAGIDASKEQILLNRYFPDEVLALLEKKVQKDEEQVEEEEGADKKKKKRDEKDASTASESLEEEVKAGFDQADAVSCPDLQDVVADVYSEDSDLLDQASKSTIVSDEVRRAQAIGKTPSQVEMMKKTEEANKAAKRKRHGGDLQLFGEEGGEGFQSYTESTLVGEESVSALAESELASLKGEDEADLKEDEESQQIEPVDDDDDSSKDKESQVASITTITESQAVSDTKEEDADVEPAASASVDLTETSVRSFDKTKPSGGEEEEEPVNLEYLREQLGAAESVTESYLMESEPPKRAPVEELGEYSVAEPEGAAEEQELVVEGKFIVDEVFVEVIPGIGPVVPKELVDAVVEYMKTCAATQHGMVMPRNIRHYSCPPLEVYQ